MNILFKDPITAFLLIFLLIFVIYLGLYLIKKIRDDL